MVTRDDPEICERTDVDAPISQVWGALVSPDERAAWWPYLTLDPSVGGRFEELWTDPSGDRKRTSGRVTAMEHPHHLALTWADDDWPAATRVEISLTATGTGTEVTIRHTGWRALADPEHLIADHRAGWRMHLHNLREHLDGTA